MKINPSGMSQKIEQVLAVLVIIKNSNPVSLSDVQNSRSVAINEVASDLGITPGAVRDKCMRQIGLPKIGIFDELVYKWLSESNRSLYNILLKNAKTQNERLKINDIFSMDTKASQLNKASRTKTASYRSILQDELDDILKKHRLWLKTDGNEGEQANFEQVILKGNELIGLNLEKSNFSSSYLEGVDLRKANLSESLFVNSNLLNTNFKSANLNRVNFTNADLKDIDFSHTGLKDVVWTNVNVNNIKGISKDVGEQLESQSKISFENNEVKSIWPLIGKRKGFSIVEDIDGVIGVKEIADEIATLLRNLEISEKGKMIGVFGKWGRGKTFLMDILWNRLQEQENNKFYKVNFHAWKYQDTPASWAYLYESFATLYHSAEEIRPLRRPFYSFARKLRLNIDRYGYLPIIGLMIPIFMYVLGLFDIISDLKIIIEKTNNVFLGISGLSIVTLIYNIYIKFNSKATDLFKKYMNRQSFNELLGVQAEIQTEFKKLLMSWITEKEVNKKGTKVLLIVDDIDRCQEKRLIQIIDSLRVMLEDDEISKRVVVLAAIDGNVLKRAIKWKYHELIETDYTVCEKPKEKVEVSNELIKEYMDKLFLSGIKLSVLTSEERLEIFESFTKDKIAPNKFINANLKNEESEQKEKHLEKEQKNDISNAEDKNDNNFSKQDSSFDLEFEEANELRLLIEKLKDATPRQIRIFYYRYLLARNLLDRQIRKFDLSSTNKSEKETSLMGELLLQYTLASSTEEILIIKKQIAEKKSEQFKIKLLGKDYTDNSELIYHVFNVLEMVIAY